MPVAGFVFGEDMMIIIGAGGGGVLGMLMAALFVYRRRRSRRGENILESKVESSTFEEEMVFDHKLEEGAGKQAVVAPPVVAPPPKLDNQRASLKGVNVQQWIQTAGGEDKEEDVNVAATMTVMFDFDAENPDELGATEGTKLLCLDQKGEWFVARNPETGQHGIIPVSFVQLDL